jgi:menaquinone-specific isochorismate synthase
MASLVLRKAGHAQAAAVQDPNRNERWMHTPSPAETPASPDRAALTPLIAQARAEARATGAPVLACYAAPLPAHDPLDLLCALGTEGGFRFYWEQPSTALALAAGGVARRIGAEGPARFGESAAQVQNALEHAVRAAELGDCPGPYVLGGFSFFDRVDAAHWPGFGAAQLVVPQWIAVRQGPDCVGVVSVAVPADAAPERVAGELEGVLARLRQAAAAPGGTPGKEPANGRNCAFHQEVREDGHAPWTEVVRLARERIRAGQLSKVVLARALDLACEAPPSALGLLRRLRAAYPDCYNFLFDPGAGQCFLGATPERMARFGNGRVRLAAMAGTVPRGRTEEADEAYARLLLESRKEREEHQIVVDGILAAVQGLGRVEYPGQPQVVKFTNVQHLYTPITLEPGGPLPILTLLERLHPTPAVGGHPREEACALIRECEHFERGWYAAPVGWMNALGEGEFAVALRTGKLAGTRLQLFAGAGIVADSDPEREFEETQIKFQPLLSALASE